VTQNFKIFRAKATAARLKAAATKSNSKTLAEVCSPPTPPCFEHQYENKGLNGCNRRISVKTKDLGHAAEKFGTPKPSIDMNLKDLVK